MPGVFIRLDYSGLLDMESAVKKILSASPRKVLLSIDTRDMPKDGQSGKTVLELMRRLRSEKADTVLLTHLGEDYLGFIPSLRLTREFGMPREPHESGDNFYIDHNDIIRTLEGRAVGHVSSYDSAGDIFRDITEGKFVQ